MGNMLPQIVDNYIKNFMSTPQKRILSKKIMIFFKKQIKKFARVK